MTGDGQYGDFRGLRVGEEVTAKITGTIVEVGGNYAEIETDAGDSYTINAEWEIVEPSIGCNICGAALPDGEPHVCARTPGWSTAGPATPPPLTERCPYCAQRARLGAEYNIDVGPCPLHERKLNAEDVSL